MLGAIIGDIAGSRFEFNNYRSKNFTMLDSKCFFTDDTVMTVAVADSLIKNSNVAKTLKKWGRKFPNRGYGGNFGYWIFSDTLEPYYSFGNGAAMRVSAAAWLAKDEDEVKYLAKKVTEVTHDHPEGLKGAEVTAMCIYYARIGKSKNFIRNYVEQYYSLKFNYKSLKKNFKFNETCQETVPQAVYCFLISKDFEDCIKTTISIGGDCDTTAAISGAIAEAYYGIPKKTARKALKFLPNSMKKVLKQFNKRVVK